MQLTARQRRGTPAESRRTGGFSMIELLVAVLVMGIGVLGVTALQMVSLQNNRGALQRAEAVQLAYDMMDRVRANPAGNPSGSAYSGLDLTDGPPNAANCNTQNCTQAQMVSFDQAIWKCSLGSFHDQNICQTLRAAGVLADEDDQPGLTAGDGSIAVDVNGVINITVQWTELANQQVRTITINSQS